MIISASYSCDLCVPFPELSPQLQTQAPQIVLAQMEFLIFSLIILLSIFSACQMAPQSLRNLGLSSGTPTLPEPRHTFLTSSLNCGVSLVLLSQCRHALPLTCLPQWTSYLPCLLLTVPFSPLQLTTKHRFCDLGYIEPSSITSWMASNEWMKCLQVHSWANYITTQPICLRPWSAELSIRSSLNVFASINY